MAAMLYESTYFTEDEPGLAKRMQPLFKAEMLRIAPEYQGRLKVTVHKGRLRVRIEGRGDRAMAAKIVEIVERRIGL